MLSVNPLPQLPEDSQLTLSFTSSEDDIATPSQVIGMLSSLLLDVKRYLILGSAQSSTGAAFDGEPICSKYTLML